MKLLFIAFSIIFCLAQVNSRQIRSLSPIYINDPYVTKAKELGFHFSLDFAMSTSYVLRIDLDSKLNKDLDAYYTQGTDICQQGMSSTAIVVSFTKQLLSSTISYFFEFPSSLNKDISYSLFLKFRETIANTLTHGNPVTLSVIYKKLLLDKIYSSSLLYGDIAINKAFGVILIQDIPTTGIDTFTVAQANNSATSTSALGATYVTNITFLSSLVFSMDQYSFEVEITNTDEFKFDATKCTFPTVSPELFTESDYSCSLSKGLQNHLQIRIKKKLTIEQVYSASSRGLTFQVEITNPTHNLPNSVINLVPHIRGYNNQEILASFNSTITLQLTSKNYIGTGGIQIAWGINLKDIMSDTKRKNFMGIYTHAYVQTDVTDALQLTNIWENKIVYNTVKFYWTTSSDLLSDIPYEVSAYYFLESTTYYTTNEDATVLLKSILHNFEDYSSTQKVTCTLDILASSGSETFYPMIKGKRIFCTNVRAPKKDTTYYIAFKVAYSHAKWVEKGTFLYQTNFGQLYIQGVNTVSQKVTYLQSDLLLVELGSTDQSTLKIKQCLDVADVNGVFAQTLLSSADDRGMVYRETAGSPDSTDIKFEIRGRGNATHGYLAAQYPAINSYGLEVVTNPELQVYDATETRNGTDCSTLNSGGGASENTDICSITNITGIGTRIAIQNTGAQTLKHFFPETDGVTISLTLPKMKLAISRSDLMPVMQYTLDFFGTPATNLSQSSVTTSDGNYVDRTPFPNDIWLWNSYVVVTTAEYTNMWGTSVFNTRKQFLSYSDIDYMPGFIRIGGEMTTTILDEIKLGKKLAVFFTKMRPLKHLDNTVSDEVYCYSTNLAGIKCTYTNSTSTFVTPTVKEKGNTGAPSILNKNIGTYNPLFEEYIEIEFSTADTTLLTADASFQILIPTTASNNYDLISYYYDIGTTAVKTMQQLSYRDNNGYNGGTFTTELAQKHFIPITFGLTSDQTIDGNTYPLLSHLSEFLTNKGTGAASPFQIQEDLGNNGAQQFQITADGTISQSYLGQTMNTTLQFKTDATSAIQQNMDSVNDYTDSLKIGALGMYCASWNFHEHSSFSWGADTFTGTGKEYKKCQKLSYKYTKEKIIRDIETQKIDSGGLTPITKCAVKEKYEIINERFCLVCPNNLAASSVLTLYNYTQAPYPIYPPSRQDAEHAHNFQFSPPIFNSQNDSNTYNYDNDCHPFTDTTLRNAVIMNTDNVGQPQLTATTTNYMLMQEVLQTSGEYWPQKFAATLTMDPPLTYKTSSYNNLIFEVTTSSSIHRETAFMVAYSSTIQTSYPRKDVDFLFNNSACVFYNSTHESRNCRPLTDQNRVKEYDWALKPPTLFVLWLDKNWDAGTYTLKLIGAHHINRNSDSDNTNMQLYMMYPLFDYNPQDSQGTDNFNMTGNPPNTSTVNTYYNYDIPYRILTYNASTPMEIGGAVSNTSFAITFKEDATVVKTYASLDLKNITFSAGKNFQMTSDVTIELKNLNQGIHGYRLYDLWSDRHGKTANYTRTTQKIKLNMGNYGTKISSLKPRCEVYLGSATGLPDFDTFPYCDIAQYDSLGGIFIDVNGTIAANSTIIIKLLGMRIEEASLSVFKTQIMHNADPTGMWDANAYHSLVLQNYTELDEVMVTSASTWAANLTQSTKENFIVLTKQNSFKGLKGSYLFSMTLKKENITTNTIMTMKFPQYYTSQLGDIIRCEMNQQIQSCEVTSDQTVTLMGFKQTVNINTVFTLEIIGVTQPLVTASQIQDIFISFHSAIAKDNFTSYGLVADQPTDISPKLLYLEDITLSNPHLLESSTYEFQVKQIGINMTTNASIKDINIVFPSTEFFFDTYLQMGCFFFKISNGTEKTIPKNCHALHNRIHIDTTENLTATDGLKIMLTQIPNPSYDSNCLYHAWDITISERTDKGVPIQATSTIVETYTPVLDYTKGTRQRIIFWDPVGQKEIKSERVQILIGIYSTIICLKPETDPYFHADISTISLNPQVLTQPPEINVVKGKAMSCFQLAGAQPAPQKDANGQDIVVTQLLKSFDQVRFEAFSGSTLYQNLNQLQVTIEHVKQKIAIPEFIFCNQGGVSTPVVIDLESFKPLSNIDITVQVATVASQEVTLKVTNPIPISPIKATQFFNFQCSKVLSVGENIQITLGLTGKSSIFYELSSTTFILKVIVKDTLVNKATIVGQTQEVATESNIQMKCDKVGQFFWHINRAGAVRRTFKEIQAIVLNQNLLISDYQEAVGVGFSSIPAQLHIVKIENLWAKTIYKMTLYCLNLMEVTNEDYLTFTTKTNNGEISRIDITFDKVSQQEYVYAIDQTLCQLAQIFHIMEDQIQDRYSNKCKKKSARVLVGSDYFKTHEHANIYLMPRLDVNLDDTSTKIAALSTVRMYSILQAATSNKLVLKTVDFVPKITQSNPKIQQSLIQTVKGYSWIAFKNIKLSHNGLVYFYYRETPKTRRLGSTHNQYYQSGLTTLGQINSKFKFTIIDFRNFLTYPRTKIYQYAGGSTTHTINMTVKYAKKYQVVMLVTEEEPAEHAFLTDFYEIEVSSKLSPELDAQFKQSDHLTTQKFLSAHSQIFSTISIAVSMIIYFIFK